MKRKKCQVTRRKELFYYVTSGLNVTRDVHWCVTVDYQQLFKTGSLDNAIREFSLAKPSWYMSHYTMLYKNAERMRDFLGLFVFIEV